jgi:hypothetical protein
LIKEVFNMAKIVEVHDTGDGEGGASGAIWFVAFLIIVAILAGAVYYSGILNKSPAGGGTQKIDIDVKAPAR